MKLLASAVKNIKIAAAIIRKGGLVIFPTETVYGLGADALNPLAVGKIFEVKKRPYFDPLIVHIHDISYLESICQNVPSVAKKLAQKFWPGPLTLVLPKKDIVPDITTAGLKTVAVRMPSHPAALKLIKESGVPIAAPSANLFGYLSPTSCHDIKEKMQGAVDIILDGGKCELGIESTVIKVEKDIVVVLRPGAVEIEEIEKDVGKVKVVNKKSKQQESPGQLSSHYSPTTPLKVIKNKKCLLPSGKKIGLLAFKKVEKKDIFHTVEILSHKGDLREAAANFFSSLHRLDKAGLDIIYAEEVPRIGLGYAIMDRLRKAESK